MRPADDLPVNGHAEEEREVVLEEKALRVEVERSCFIRRCAQCLILDAEVSATAVILSQQYFAARGDQLDYHVIGGACIFLATKSCEVPRTLRSIVNVVHAVMNDTTEPLGADAMYSNLKNSIINAEQSVLRVLQFNVDIVLPYLYLFNYVRHGGFHDATAQCALALVNDTLCAWDALRFPPFALAAGCLRVASRLLEDKGAHGEERWWYEYDTSDQDMDEIARLLQRIYSIMDKPSPLQSGDDDMSRSPEANTKMA